MKLNIGICVVVDVRIRIIPVFKINKVTKQINKIIKCRYQVCINIMAIKNSNKKATAIIIINTLNSAVGKVKGKKISDPTRVLQIETLSTRFQTSPSCHELLINIVFFQ